MTPRMPNSPPHCRSGSASARDNTPAHVNAGGAHGVVLHDLLPVKENHQSFFVSLCPTVHDVDVGNEISGLRLHSGELVFPGLEAVGAERGLDWIAVELAHIGLCRLALEQLAGDGGVCRIRNAFI